MDMNGAEKRRVVNSLNRVAGHTKGIKGMVHSGRCISEILLQLSAIRAGTLKVQVQVLKTCFSGKRYSAQELKEMSSLVVQYPS
jgi:DNA-binding FrmR family transcriptional regulator